MKILSLAILFSFILSLQGCFVYGKKKALTLTTTSKVDTSLSADLTSVNIANDQVTITGSGFSQVSQLKIQGSGVDATLTIDSKSDTQIIASAASALSLLVGGAFNLILSTANASASFPITFTLQNGAVTANKLAQMGATNGQVLQWNGTTSVWEPANMAASQVYSGSWNATTNVPDLIVANNPANTFQNGDYYIVSVGGTNLGHTFAAGDWIMFNGTSWDKVDNSSNKVTAFNTRTGSVTLQTSDYTYLINSGTGKITASSLNHLADVDLTAIGNGKVLKYNGVSAKWEADVDDTVSASSVSTTSIQDNAVTYAKLNIADGEIPQAKITGLVTALSGKEPTVATGTSADYYRGDKTWQTLTTAIIPELTNLYFTNARVLTATISAPTLTDSAIAGGDTIQVALGKLQAQTGSLSSRKADLTNIAQTITAAAVTGLTAPVAGSDAANMQYVDSAVASAIATATSSSNSWTASGADVYRASGKVGIGTSTPVKGLQVANGISVGTQTFTYQMFPKILLGEY